jgi:hypothetical protein
VGLALFCCPKYEGRVVASDESAEKPMRWVGAGCAKALGEYVEYGGEPDSEAEGVWVGVVYAAYAGVMSKEYMLRGWISGCVVVYVCVLQRLSVRREEADEEVVVVERIR